MGIMDRIEIMRKAARVINSCETVEQRETAAKYIDLMESAIYPDPLKKELPRIHWGFVTAMVSGVIIAIGVLVLVGWMLMQVV